MASFETVWQRIVALDGEQFRQKRGRQFRYAISGSSLIPSTRNRQLPRSHFAKALSQLGPSVDTLAQAARSWEITGAAPR